MDELLDELLAAILVAIAAAATIVAPATAAALTVTAAAAAAAPAAGTALTTRAGSAAFGRCALDLGLLDGTVLHRGALNLFVSHIKTPIRLRARHRREPSRGRGTGNRHGRILPG